MSRRILLLPVPLLLSAGCALIGPRPGPAPDAPTESALSAAPTPDVCRVSPGSLRRIGPLEAGTTPFEEAVRLLGRPPLAPGAERACWLVSDAPGVALFAHGRIADQPIRSLALTAPDPDSARTCGTTHAISPPVALQAGLGLGATRDDVEKVLGPLTVDAGGAFGKECCGLEQTGETEQGPVYGFGCSAVLGAFKDGQLTSLLVSRYAPPAANDDR